MPMVLYTTEELIRDMVNAISSSEGKPVDIGGREHRDIDRAYLYQLVGEVKRAVEGKPVPRRRATAAKAAPATGQAAIPARARRAIAAAKAAQGR
jgi:hypothetical protein